MTLNPQTLADELTVLSAQTKKLAREAANHNGDMTPRVLATAIVEVGKLGDRLVKLRKQLRSNGTARR